MVVEAVLAYSDFGRNGYIAQLCCMNLPLLVDLIWTSIKRTIMLHTEKMEKFHFYRFSNMLHINLFEIEGTYSGKGTLDLHMRSGQTWRLTDPNDIEAVNVWLNRFSVKSTG